MSWVIAISHCVYSHVLRAVINTGGKNPPKTDALLCEDRNILVGSTGFALVPNVQYPVVSVVKAGAIWEFVSILVESSFSTLFSGLFCYCMPWNNGVIGMSFFNRCLLSLLAI